MKVLIITGSPHKNGTTACLTEQFIRGAEESGHEIYLFDAAQKDIHPCIACEKCHTDTVGCVFKDDMTELNPHLIEADVVVLVSPVYYYDVSAQLKAVIDRFYANDASLHGDKKAVLMLAMADSSLVTANGAIASFKGMTNYLEWEIAGIISAVSCMTADMIRSTEYPRQAYDLGKSL